MKMMGNGSGQADLWHCLGFNDCKVTQNHKKDGVFVLLLTHLCQELLTI